MLPNSMRMNAYEGLCHKDKIAELKKVLSSQQNFFKEVVTRTDSIVKASYVVAYLIAKKNLLMVSLLSNV